MTGSMNIRRNVWELGEQWEESIIWYARGVAAMKERPLADPLGWRFFAAIHGFNAERWQEFEYLDPATDAMPSDQVRSAYWQQCWHGSWYFLPWHRGYTIALEATVRAEIITLGGPSDWTLPYWDYFTPGQQSIPPAFATPEWPGDGVNPLFVSARYGRHGDGVVVIPLDDPDFDISLIALDDAIFAGAATGGAVGFGGADTGPAHHRATHGHLEAQPHDLIHVLIGGVEQPGLMTSPSTAGLDPIFWLHHANIDRLWEIWRRESQTHSDPADSSWLNGPAAGGGSPFVMPLPATGEQGWQQWSYTPSHMSDLNALGYGYDNYEDNETTQRRRTAIHAAPPNINAVDGVLPPGQEMTMTESTPSGDAELIGATRGPMSIVGAESTAALILASDTRLHGPSLVRAGVEDRPDRIYLNLENITAARDGAILRVYVRLPGSVAEQVAGSVALFGATSDSGTDTADNDGLTVALDITDLVEDLQLTDSDMMELSIRVVPVGVLDAASDVRIGRLGLYRQPH